MFMKRPFCVHQALFRRKRDVDMTEGNIAHHIIAFAIPLLVGNLFQQLYNTVDTWVVGNYVSNEAFSAVGTVGPITNLLIGFFTGLASGAGVVISQFYGARRQKDVHDAVHTAIVLTLILGVVFTALGILMVPYMLDFMKTPEEVIPDASAYLTIYFAGILGLMLYNMGSGILRAVGDSQRPFYFLMVCALMNIILDLVFVLCFQMGVAGVAWATVVSQLISAFLVIFTLLRSDNCVQLRIRELSINPRVLKKMFLVGIPAALQMAVTSFSNIFVQSYINYFGSDCMSGWTAYTKIDQLLLLPMQSIALAVTTFVGQNLGKLQTERAQKGVHIAVTLGIAFTVIVMIPVLIFAPAVVAFFNHKPEVVDCGTMLLRWLSPFYVLCCFNQVYAGALRGAGNSKAPMFIMLSSFVLFRQAYLFFMARICNEVLPIAMSYPAGWLLCSLLMAVYYRRVKFSKNSVMPAASEKQI